MARFVSEGKTIDYRPTATVPAGAVVVVGTGVTGQRFGSLVGVASREIPAGQLGALIVWGVVEVQKAAADSIAAGADIYWSTTTQQATTTATNNHYLGKSVAAAGSGTSVVLVHLGL